MRSGWISLSAEFDGRIGSTVQRMQRDASPSFVLALPLSPVCPAQLFVPTRPRYFRQLAAVRACQGRVAAQS